MDRLTDECWRNLDDWECCGQDSYCKRDGFEKGGCHNGCIVPKIYHRLAKYEDTGLNPEEITTMKAEYSDTFQAHLNELLDIKDRRIAELESENKRLIEIIKENKS